MLKNILKFKQVIVCKIEICPYICTRNEANNTTCCKPNGEILKRPTRADCKSAVQTSQVRILLSPLNLQEIGGFFLTIF